MKLKTKNNLIDLAIILGIVLFNPLSIIFGGNMIYDHFNPTPPELSIRCKPYPGNRYEVRNIGSVVSNNEVCVLEEVVDVRFCYDTYGGDKIPDIKNKCYWIKPCIEKPLVRRMICPSGKNGQSSVDYETHNKQVHEVLK